MYSIQIWHKKSTNFNANQFVKNNGTMTISCETAQEAMDLMHIMLIDSEVAKFVAETPRGILTWDTMSHNRISDF